MTTDRWTAASAAADAGSPVAVEQFERHGFVHCCFREQLSEIATWWFAPSDQLVAVEIDPAPLGPLLRIEHSASRWYPHVYGPIAAEAVRQAHPIPRSPGGPATLPHSLREPTPGFQLTGSVDGGGDAVVRWRPGLLDGDDSWIAAAREAINNGRPVALVGGICVPPDLARAYESYALLAEVADTVTGYDGDGFFDWPRL
jgi:uncharacterized protein (DUF952 family)